MTIPVRLALSAVLAAALAGCYYPAPVMQQSYAFSQHPGVYLQTWYQYDAYGTPYQAVRLVNQGPVDKCAWTEALGSRLLHAGETWQMAQVLAPGAVGVANVLPTDPNCVYAGRATR